MKMTNEKRAAIAALFEDVDSDREVADILRCVGTHVMRNTNMYKAAYDAQTKVWEAAYIVDPKCRNRLVSD